MSTELKHTHKQSTLTSDEQQTGRAKSLIEDIITFINNNHDKMEFKDVLNWQISISLSAELTGRIKEHPNFLDTHGKELNYPIKVKRYIKHNNKFYTLEEYKGAELVDDTLQLAHMCNGVLLENEIMWAFRNLDFTPYGTQGDQRIMGAFLPSYLTPLLDAQPKDHLSDPKFLATVAQMTSGLEIFYRNRLYHFPQHTRAQNIITIGKYGKEYNLRLCAVVAVSHFC